ncbi:Vacuolar protein sorting-associated protein 45 [Gracilariopsis chorda]|uniref:Vacuolar protein sorting-associated protein 45 n=1 Tax=Gracilariopsis chorda TaxID=448386 RepID=A0A2V3IZI9_9FLOR|nr:Vacuolar protein sorting-associated protein 45 [Gracilariopsis chorda]|eukprot:PXF47576.1 Vacuolar protein sorting-associated protein 45 [Gracilariopsis chorda]
MDPRASLVEYVNKLVGDSDDIKALLLDDETAKIVSLITSQSDLLKREVLLIEKLNADRTQDLSHMQAVIFVRPTAENVHVLRKELREPHYKSYKVVFSNVVRRTLVEEIADADEMELVTEVREMYGDFFVLDRHLVSFEVCPCLDAIQSTSGAIQNPLLERTIDGVLAVLLSLKRRPDIRYQGSSPLCRNIGERLCVRIDQEGSLFDFRPRDVAPLLLIIDRREDPVTPLLNQWTYEAMIHELIGMQCNRVSLKDADNVPDEFRELVLDDNDDSFFEQNRYKNFGELGVNLKELVDSFQLRSNSSSNLKTIDDMMRFVGNYPEFRKSSSNVSKHVAIAGELSHLVGKMDLLEVSQLEQDLACREAEGDHRKQIMELLKEANVSLSDKLRLVMLYSLRYEGKNERGLPAMREALRKAGVGPEGIQLISSVREYAGISKRSGDVFSNRTFFAMASNTVRRGIGGVENVYTQHEPLLATTLDDLLRNRLKNDNFPMARQDDGAFGTSLIGTVDTPATVPVPKEVLVLLAGGTTYEESRCVSGINGGTNCFVPPEGSVTASAAAAARQEKVQVLLMGTCVHNSTSFAVEISRNAASENQNRLLRSG